MYNFGFAEWFLCIWIVCYFITYMMIIYHDRRVENWMGYSVICIYLWPLMWAYWFYGWFIEDKQK